MTTTKASRNARAKTALRYFNCALFLRLNARFLRLWLNKDLHASTISCWQGYHVSWRHLMSYEWTCLISFRLLVESKIYCYKIKITYNLMATLISCCKFAMSSWETAGGQMCLASYTTRPEILIKSAILSVNLIGILILIIISHHNELQQTLKPQKAVKNCSSSVLIAS
jgi:hypothetical protein